MENIKQKITTQKLKNFNQEQLLEVAVILSNLLFWCSIPGADPAVYG